MSCYDDKDNIQTLVGKKLLEIVDNSKHIGTSEKDVLFQFICEGDVDEKHTYSIVHYQSCCESVGFEFSDLSNYLDKVITKVKTEVNSVDGDYGSYTDTYYYIYFGKRYATIKFTGSSNGYYSEGVSFVCEDKI